MFYILGLFKQEKQHEAQISPRLGVSLYLMQVLFISLKSFSDT
jgi:hypothetical protein